MQPSQASMYPYILCQRSRKVVPSDSSRNVASATPCLSFPVLGWPWGVFVRCQPHYVRVRDRMGWAMRCCISLPHDLTYPSQGQPLHCAAFSVGFLLSHRHTTRLIPTRWKVFRICLLYRHATSQSRFVLFRRLL